MINEKGKPGEAKMDEESRMHRNLGQSTYESHPAYGSARFSRVQGNPGRLFGSQLEVHHNFVSLTISTAEVSHNLGKDYILPDREVIEVYFSPAQFAQLLTTMNVGEGTACTMKYVVGEKIIPVPEDEKMESEKCYDDFKEKSGEFTKELDVDMKTLFTMLEEKPTIVKKDRKEIQRLLQRISTHVHSNANFALRNFQAAVDKTTKAAQAEIDSMWTGLVHRAGLESIKKDHVLTDVVELDKALGEGIPKDKI